MARKRARMREDVETLDLDRFEPFLINSVTRRFNGRLEAAFRRKRLSIYDWRLLATLANTPLKRPADVAGYIAIDPSTLSRMIDRFVRAGAMLRRKPAGAARITELALTKAGHSLYEAAFMVIAQERDRLVGALTAAEKQQLLRLLVKICDRYEPAAAWQDSKPSAA